MNDIAEISAIPLAQAVPPAGFCWAVRRRELYLAPLAPHINYDLRRATWTRAESNAKPFSDLRIAGITAAWLVQFAGIPPDELGVVQIPIATTTPVRERMLNRTIQKAKQQSLVKSALQQVAHDNRHNKQAGFAGLPVVCAIVLALLATAGLHMHNKPKPLPQPTPVPQQHVPVKPQPLPPVVLPVGDMTRAVDWI